MSHPHWESFPSNHHFPHGVSVEGGGSSTTSGAPSIDAAIDAALRSVPLPVGMLTRLEMSVDAITGEAADQVDWLGC